MCMKKQTEFPGYLQHIVEDICSNGCEAVNQIIKSLQNEETVEAVESLNQNERQRVLAELSDIMSVYEQQ